MVRHVLRKASETTTMRTRPLFCFALCLGLGLAGCDPVADPAAEPSNAAGGKADHLGDVCDDEDRYGDGVCDVACEHPDPDCEDEGRPACGGPSGWACEEPDTFCQHDPERNVCGERVDDVGHCEAFPLQCPDDGLAVCGCDHESYQNDCLAAQAGTSVAHLGLCPPEVPPTGETCGSFFGDTCAAGEYCHLDVVAACGVFDAPGVCAQRPNDCPDVLDAVCGCDGQAYDNECVAHAAGTSVANFGPC